MKYKSEVDAFLKVVKDSKTKDRVVELYNYINRDFATEIAFIERDYALGLCQSNERNAVMAKSYNLENELRGYLGLDALPAIDLSII